MGKVLFGVLAVVASFMLVDSLICNKCSFGVVGICLNSAEETCAGNDTVCFTGRATFPSVSAFSGFNSQGCRVNDTLCNQSANATLLGVSYTTQISCCSTDRCNPITLNSAPSAKMTFTATVGAAILASVWGSML